MLEMRVRPLVRCQRPCDALNSIEPYYFRRPFAEVGFLARMQSNGTKAMHQGAPDYTTWSSADLIKRVSDLEAQLRAQNVRHSQILSSRGPPTLPKKKPKKASKPFDPSKYNTRLIALKFAYLGRRYHGFEHHSNNTTPLPTIEEELWKALGKTKLISPQFRDGQSKDEVCWDGCEYSKCGRTDRGVSAFGQVVGLRVRSSRRKEMVVEVEGKGGELANGTDNGQEEKTSEESLMPGTTALEPAWDPVNDELPYIQLLNRVLPSDIRILAWCPNPPPDFSARFNCKERRYRYFFTNPAYVSAPSSSTGNGPWLDIPAMQKAAKSLEGLHDFRNFCKIDPSKQITNFERRIFSASIEKVRSVQASDGYTTDTLFAPESRNAGLLSNPDLFYFEVRGSAFLWHQVRHLVAILFLVGQGYEEPSIVDELLDVEKCPRKPMYEIGADAPLVLWDCVFPEPIKAATSIHGSGQNEAYEDALDWIYAGDEVGGRDSAKRNVTGIEDGKYGRNGIMEDLWTMWRKYKMTEVLAGSLMDVVARQSKPACPLENGKLELGEGSDRVFDGSETPRTVGKYIPIMQRARMETPDVVNARYAARKGVNDNRSQDDEEADMDE